MPGPQFPLYLLGRRCAPSTRWSRSCENTALGIAIMSYNGRIDFGLLGDYDALPDLDDLAAALERAIDELAAVPASEPGLAPRGAGAEPARARLTQ